MTSTAALPAASSDPCIPEELGDPDVTGIGVLVSSLVSVFFIVVATIVGYFRNKLPDSCYSEFDDVLLRRKWRGKDVEAFNNFILSMSDQQLVYCLALIVATYIIWLSEGDVATKMSVYAFANAIILAFFSCTIHLTAHRILESYLAERSPLKLTRVIVMGLEFYAIVPLLARIWSADTNLTLDCSYYQSPFDTDYSSNDDPLDVRYGPSGIALSFVILVGMMGAAITKAILSLTPSSIRKRLSFPVMSVAVSAASAADKHEAEQRLVQRMSGPRLGLGGLARLAFLVVPLGFLRSFMFDIVWLVFFFVTGITQVLYYLAPWTQNQADISFKLNFGQLLPLILLLLPFLSSYEAYCDERVAQKKSAQKGTEVLSSRTNPIMLKMGSNEPEELVQPQIEESGSEHLALAACYGNHKVLVLGLCWACIVSCTLCWIFVAIAISYDLDSVLSVGRVSIMIVVSFALAGILVLYPAIALTYEFFELGAETRRVTYDREVAESQRVISD